MRMRSSTFSMAIGLDAAIAGARWAIACGLLLCLPLSADAARATAATHTSVTTSTAGTVGTVGTADVARMVDSPYPPRAARTTRTALAGAVPRAGAGRGVGVGADANADADAGRQPYAEVGVEAEGNGGRSTPSGATAASPAVAAQDIAARDVAARDIAARDAGTRDIGTRNVGTGDIAVQDVAAPNVAATITFAEFMDGVRRQNIAMAAAATTVRAARAQRRIASARPDWTASVSLPTYDLSRLGAPSAMSLGIEAPIELGGKRRARLRVADADLTLADAQRADADRQILAAAATAFVDALGARLALDARAQTLAHLTRLVEANAQRVRAGDIGEMELVQSRVERDQFRAEVLQAEADVRAATLAMGQFLGDGRSLSATTPGAAGAIDSPSAAAGAAAAPSGADTAVRPVAVNIAGITGTTGIAGIAGVESITGIPAIAAGPPSEQTPLVPAPAGSLDSPSRTFDVEQLVSQALASRADAVAAARTLQAADARVALARATLAPDLAAGIVYQRTGLGTGDFAQPRDQMLGATLAVTLPFSRRRAGGDLEAARVARSAADLTARATRLAIATEVRQAHARYAAAAARLDLYRGGILQEAQRLLDARLYAYARGGATLLELIEAQRRAADVSLAAAEALAEHARALIALEAAAGIWDVTF